MGVNKAKAEKAPSVGVLGESDARRPRLGGRAVVVVAVAAAARGLHGASEASERAAGWAAAWGRTGSVRMAGAVRVGALGLPTPSLPLPSRSPTKPPSFLGVPQAHLPGA